MKLTEKRPAPEVDMQEDKPEYIVAAESTATKTRYCSNIISRRR